MDLGTMIVELDRKIGDIVDENALAMRANAFMTRVHVPESMQDELRALLVAQAKLLICGVRPVHKIHKAMGKFSTAEFKVRVVVIVRFA